jgi:hypothetical protein
MCVVGATGCTCVVGENAAFLIFVPHAVFFFGMIYAFRRSVVDPFVVFLFVVLCYVFAYWSFVYSAVFCFPVEVKVQYFY